MKKFTILTPTNVTASSYPDGLAKGLVIGGALMKLLIHNFITSLMHAIHSFCHHITKCMTLRSTVAAHPHNALHLTSIILYSGTTLAVTIIAHN